MDSFEELLPAIIKAFDDIENLKANPNRKYNKETVTRSAYLYKAIDFEFLANLVITH